jgi:hypothetical protein
VYLHVVLLSKCSNIIHQTNFSRELYHKYE